MMQGMPTPAADCELVAILRGITAAEARPVADALIEAGVRTLEVPLNSPRPFESIALLAAHVPADVVVGAGTVVVPEDVDRVRDAGGRLVVAPNTDPEVIGRAIAQGLTAYPGVATATDVFAALRAGARTLKIFPADVVGIAGMRAWSATVPEGTRFLPVGGVGPGSLRPWLAAGAAGAGIGSALYTPGRSAEEVGRIAADLVAEAAADRTS